MEDNQIKKELPNTEKDFLLQQLANFADKGVGTQVTLLCHGYLVSGTVIGGKEYFNELGKQFGELVGEELEQAFIKWGEKIYNSEIDVDRTTYIHLKNVKFFHPNANPIPMEDGLNWRGRLTEVAGFSIGRLTTG